LKFQKIEEIEYDEKDNGTSVKRKKDLKEEEEEEAPKKKQKKEKLFEDEENIKKLIEKGVDEVL
jgi:hypothetical protein